MLEFVKNPTGRVMHVDASVSHNIIDNSAVPSPVSISNTGTLFVPIFAEKGLDVNVEYVRNGMNDEMLAIEVFETQEIAREKDDDKNKDNNDNTSNNNDKNNNEENNDQKDDNLKDILPNEEKANNP